MIEYFKIFRGRIWVRKSKVFNLKNLKYNRVFLNTML